MQRLDKETFKTVVASTPLVSIDLIISNSCNQVLLGLRTNRPAQGFWFVPGGRIGKDETFEQAFLRLTQLELGYPIPLNEASFLGPYQHLYSDNFSGTDFSTHYVVLGYQIMLDLDLQTLPVEQHQNYQWWDEQELLNSDLVHRNTKAYFSDNYK
ncbi:MULTISPECIES: GDP-mannose mannosyl hydrolase [Vibrio]|uniref:GDP-mannose mannosyl hydrolase n=1 Tax=Vibrio TaxID=662 RepID=UPI0014823BD6|nr:MULTISPECIES: GDP-mannose mannosyl hydrolase [Vibrio]EKO3632745.1 GDP-mannose mannosyl hydrolase [Vibrio metschnikovii]EKO3670990.1 GDP-mannose mannosyl hydrolase [Vibrio metschnikovii]EKO3717654.1 GDP-mannose mannosyl hydrolase [Vibrio metschnikovii]MCO7030097.1 GDP-mannose mannosyl hydrolase [Vibrio paracholerae]NNN84142.1 GDP-mannose mannosyl hydrolase [Vibrio sp. A8-1]